MTDYHEIWESINRESADSGIKTQIARKVHSDNGIPVFLATDFHQGVRFLYVGSDKEYNISPDSLPRFKGLEVSLSTATLAKFTNQEFLRFTQSIPETDNIFELVISDITENIIKLRDVKYLHRTLVTVLNEWKLFFEKTGNENMSHSEQQGLFGELLFLRDYLLKKYSPSEAFLYWTGADRTNHDFQIKNVAVEIKTTSGRNHNRFTVASEKQLDATGLEHLYLAFYSLNLHANQPALTLPVLIQEIHEIIKETESSARFQFELSLTKYGYSEKSAADYDCGFSVSKFSFFEVKEGFPRLIRSDLPDGVENLKYTVAETSCLPFEIKTDITGII